jgi:acyl-CoA reductase-like NAD-dependent aldehyde dehydrogenase
MTHPASTTATPTITVINPITNAEIGTVPNSTPEQVRAAVDRARAAQPAWDARGAQARAHLVQQWADVLWRHRDKLIAIIRSETGKTDTGALLEVLVLDLVMNYYARKTPRLLKPQRRRTLVPLAQHARVYYSPFGVVGLITPWNYPYLNGLLDLIPALVAGNTVVLKPSEITPFTALRAVELAHQVGIPADVIQVITGDGATGAALVDEVDYVAVTGSTATGRKIAQRAAARLIPYTLELGGKDAAIILDDADPDHAALGVLQGALENAGQTCVSVERVYVLDALYDRFIARLEHHVSRMNVSGKAGRGVHMGSMTNDREIERCEAQIADAVAKGARVLLGGKRRPDIGPRFFEPTILVDVDHSMAVMQEETFGPLIPVMRVKSAEEAVALANDNVYGLSSSIFAADLQRAEALAQQIQAGDTSINRAQWVFSSPTLPMGGRGQSGTGRRGGPEGLYRFVTPHSVLVDHRWVTNRTLTHLDPLLYRLLVWTRPLLKWFPFLRP